MKYRVVKQTILVSDSGGLGIHLQNLPLNGDFVLQSTVLYHSEVRDKAHVWYPIHSTLFLS
jgi:hypothetical protein